MAVPADRQELLGAIEKSFGRLMKELENIPADLVAGPAMDGHAKGTRMSVCDLVAYLIGWNELVLKWLDRDARGEPVDFPDTGYKWNELGKLAGKFYRDYSGLAYPQLLERLRLAKERIVAFIDETDNARLYGQPWYGKWTMGRMIQFNTSSPYDNAYSRLTKWRRENGIPRFS